MDIRLNMCLFEGNFDRMFFAFEYSLLGKEMIDEDIKSRVLGRALREFKSRFPDVIFVQFLERIYGVGAKRELPSEFTVEYRDKEYIFKNVWKGKLTFDDHKEVIGLVLTDIVARKLRKSGFRVSRRYVFDVEVQAFEKREVSSFGGIDIFRGAIFRAYPFGKSRVGLVIEPRYRFLRKETIKEEIKRLLKRYNNYRKVADVLRGCKVVDFCPDNACPKLCDPSQECPFDILSPYRHAVIVDVVDDEARSSKVYEYNVSQCERLSKYIDVSDPVVAVSFPGTSQEYDYPPARLRRTLTLSDLSRSVDLNGDFHLLKILQDKFQLPPFERYFLTLSYAKRVGSITVNGKTVPLQLSCVNVSEREKLPSMRLFSPPALLFYGNMKSNNPIEGLYNFGPFSRNQFKKINVLVIAEDGLEQKIIRSFLKSLIEGYEKFRGFNNIFRTRMEINDVIRLRYPFEIEKSYLRKKPDILLCLLRERSRQYYFDIKSRFVSKGLLQQIVFPDKLLGKRVNLGRRLLNIALGIYAKVGGIPWILSQQRVTKTCYVGLDIRYARGSVYVSACFFDENGRWLGSYTKLDGLNVDEMFKKALTAYSNLKHDFPFVFVVHRAGSFRKKEIEAISRYFRESGDNYALVEVIKNHIFRVYDLASKDYVSRDGVTVTLDSDTFLVNTTGFPFYMKKGTPRPLLIKVKGDHVISVDDLIRGVYYLSFLHWGYFRSKIRFPITVFYAKKLADMIVKGIYPDKRLLEKPWFI